MKNKMIKSMGMTIVAVLSLSNIAVAEQNSTESVPVVSAVVKADTLKLVDIAGRQRMLSQRMAKDYMYVGNKVAVSKASKQLKTSQKEFLEAHNKLVNSINNEEIKNLLAFVQMGSEDFEAMVKESFTTDNAQLVLDLSESMLEGSQYVVASLREALNIKASKIVDMSGRQRMLSQRIAKYYIAYQSGIKDKNTVDQMHETVKLFNDSHEILMLNKENTPEINRKLNEIEKLWKIVHKFYLNIEKGGLPYIVFSTTDKITTKMNEVTKLYVEIYK
jgi:hypothetical protein